LREIKFRGKCINGEWVAGLLSISQGTLTQPEKGYYISNSVGMPWAYQVRPESVGQFTGKRDRNSHKEIYEGQKVRGFYDKTLVGENEFHEDGVVVWNNELGSFSIDRGYIKPAFSCFDSFKILED